MYQSLPGEGGRRHPLEGTITDTPDYKQFLERLTSIKKDLSKPNAAVIVVEEEIKPDVSTDKFEDEVLANEDEDDVNVIAAKMKEKEPKLDDRFFKTPKKEKSTFFPFTLYRTRKNRTPSLGHHRA